MQKRQEKYNYAIALKKWGACFIFMLPALILSAQKPDWADSVQELKYQLDTVQVMDSVITGQEEEYDDEEQEVDEENDKKEEYFLRKEFTGGFTDTLSARKLPADIVKALKEDKAFWYADEVFKKQKQKREEADFSGNSFLQTILWLVIIGGFVTFLVIYLANSNTALFRKSRQISNEEPDPETSDIFSINYQAEIDKAASLNNYRLAVRLTFLRLLRNLSDRGIIQYKQDSTNFDYMMQLHGTPMFRDFTKLARSYEYSWYGHFEIDKEKYAQIKDAFENFELTVKK